MNMSTETTTNEREVLDELQALLPTGVEPRGRREARVAAMDERRRRSPEASVAIDRILLERHARLMAHQASLERDLGTVRTAQGKLRGELDKLTAPPWYPAVYLRRVDTPMGPLCEVFHGGSSRLVSTGDEVDARALVAGQVVYLGHELNALLGVASAGQAEAGETATVEHVLDDGRLVLRERDTQVLAHAAPALGDAALEPGDAVRWNRDLMIALEPVPLRAHEELFVTEYLSAERPCDLGGLAPEIELTTATFTQGIAKPELASRYGLEQGNRLLMVGPPGTGKTSIARVIASALAAATGKACRFASVKGAQLESPWVGTTQANVRALFRELNRDPRPTVLFIDEVDAIGRARGGAGGHHSDKFLSAWLTEIDGLERCGPIGIIASTNRKDLLDQALLERLSGMELFIGRPGLDAAREIFAIHLPPTLPFGPNGAEAGRTRDELIETAVGTLYSPNGDNAIAELRLRDGTARTVTARELLSGRTIEQICLQARRAAFQREAEGGTPGVRLPDMEEALTGALERLGSTLSPASAHALLPDLAQDLDVVAVEPVRRRVHAHRYLNHASGGGR